MKGRDGVRRTTNACWPVAIPSTASSVRSPPSGRGRRSSWPGSRPLSGRSSGSRPVMSDPRPGWRRRAGTDRRAGGFLAAGGGAGEPSGAFAAPPAPASGPGRPLTPARPSWPRASGPSCSPSRSSRGAGSRARTTSGWAPPSGPSRPRWARRPCGLWRAAGARRFADRGLLYPSSKAIAVRRRPRPATTPRRAALAAGPSRSERTPADRTRPWPPTNQRLIHPPRPLVPGLQPCFSPHAASARPPCTGWPTKSSCNSYTTARRGPSRSSLTVTPMRRSRSPTACADAGRWPRMWSKRRFCRCGAAAFGMTRHGAACARGCCGWCTTG